jgi:DNA (cytosine-5)-methyltransferase 1
VIVGEDPTDHSNDHSINSQDKPIRTLTEFTIFDPRHQNELVSLSAVEEDDGKDRQFEGAGIVSPYFLNEEDEGQEEEDSGAGMNPKRIRLSAILRFTFDPTVDKE